jgi:EAL domain-containing protein (putative c-di-GMP-specific phosphodiesterase class I)
MDPRRLTFEVMEGEAVTDTPHLQNIFTEYRRQGFQIALDDFGSGYSGLTRLAELRPDIIKLDRALIVDCDRNQKQLAIAASMLRLGMEIGVRVVVEGVERIGEVNALREAGARYMQGFYFAKPRLAAIDTDATIFAADKLGGLGPWTGHAKPKTKLGRNP